MNQQQSNIDKLVQDNYGLIISRACSFKPKGRTELEDFIQVAVLAFIKAVDKYDKKKAKFSTYICGCMNNAILDYICKNKDIALTNIYVDKRELPTEQFWELMPDNLTAVEKSIIMLKLENYTKAEIALILNCAQQEISDSFKEAKEKIKKANR